LKNYHNYHKILEHPYQVSKEDIIDNFRKDSNLNKIEVSILVYQIIHLIIIIKVKINQKFLKNCYIQLNLRKIFKLHLNHLNS
jgi:hypothetical protein